MSLPECEPMATYLEHLFVSTTDARAWRSEIVQNFFRKVSTRRCTIVRTTKKQSRAVIWDCATYE
jgi:hypothetical protein